MGINSSCLKPSSNPTNIDHDAIAKQYVNSILRFPMSKIPKIIRFQHLLLFAFPDGEEYYFDEMTHHFYVDFTGNYYFAFGELHNVCILPKTEKTYNNYVSFIKTLDSSFLPSDKKHYKYKININKNCSSLNKIIKTHASEKLLKLEQSECTFENSKLTASILRMKISENNEIIEKSNSNDIENLIDETTKFKTQLNHHLKILNGNENFNCEENQKQINKLKRLLTILVCDDDIGGASLAPNGVASLTKSIESAY